MIYFIRHYSDTVKIGVSDNPERRLKQLQTGCAKKLTLVATMKGDFETEKGLHNMFSSIRRRGEWFSYSNDLKYFIRAVKMNPDINNIKTLYTLSMEIRIKEKAKRLGAEHKLSKYLNKKFGV